MQDAEYTVAVVADNCPTVPWNVPTPGEAEAYKATAQKENPNFLKKDEVVKNKLGKYLVDECGAAEWEGSTQETEYVTMQV